MPITKIYAYKGAVGASTNMTSTSILNEPLVDSAVQVNAADVRITAEAKDLIRNAPQSNTVPAQITFDAGTVTLKGVGSHAFIGSNLTVNTGSDMSVLESIEEDESIQVPFGFKWLVNRS